MPTALIAASFPTPAQWTACVSGCPHNAFMLLSAEPAFLDAVVIPIREVIALVLLLAIPVRLLHRVANATPLMRRTLTPVPLFSAIASAGLALGLVVRRADAESQPRMCSPSRQSSGCRRSQSASWSGCCAGGCLRPARSRRSRAPFSRGRASKSYAN